MGGRPSYAAPLAATPGGMGRKQPTSAAVLRAHVKRTEQFSPRGRNWVVDTGASRHVCPPTAVAGALRPIGAVVETANGTVRAEGAAVVSVDGLGHDVEAIVLPGAPRLLSAGSLVERGYSLIWTRDVCALCAPCGRRIVLHVENGILTLSARATEGCGAPSGRGDGDAGWGHAGCVARHGGRRSRRRRPRQRGKRRRAECANAVIDGVAEQHRQVAHYP